MRVKAWFPGKPYGLYALLIIGIGLAGMAGWALDIHWLNSWRSGGVAMKFNAGLCFVMLGSALWFDRGEAPRPGATLWAQLLVGVVVLMGMASLCQYVWGCEWGIDQFFVKEKGGASGTFFPGRMAPTGASNRPMGTSRTLAISC